MGKKPAQERRSLEAAIQLRCVALAYIQENRRILDVLKTGVVADECSEAFDVALGCLRDLEMVSWDIQLALALLPNLL
jgi:hypothetical protein